MPKQSLLKQYLPYGVINVVSRADSLDRGICQNPEFASSFEKILAPSSCPKECSTEGSRCLSLLTELVCSFTAASDNTAHLGGREGWNG